MRGILFGLVMIGTLLPAVASAQGALAEPLAKFLSSILEKELAPSTAFKREPRTFKDDLEGAHDLFHACELGTKFVYGLRSDGCLVPRFEKSPINSPSERAAATAEQQGRRRQGADPVEEFWRDLCNDPRRRGVLGDDKDRICMMHGVSDKGSVPTDSCGTWTSARRAGSWEAGSWGRGEQWVLGFLSGIDATINVTKLSPLNGTDAQGVWAWIDNYCQAHPLDKLGDAALAFVAAHPR